MHDATPSYQRFFAELKRRHVFRIMAVYGVVGFVLLQVVDLAVPALLLPEWTYRLVAFLLLLGFPIALILAWAFESTPEGVRRHQKAADHEIHSIITAPASSRWPAGLLALAGVALLVWGAWHVGRSSAADAADVGSETRTAATAGADRVASATTSIAVLPFVNMSADPEQEYFSDGISEELLNLLAHVPQLQVAARTSSFAFKDENLEITEIGKRLGVENVLEGSVRKSGDKVRITAQLIRAEDGFHLWSETWDRTLDDIFAIQDEIAADVTQQLRVTLLGEIPKTEHTDPEAFNLVLQARHLLMQRRPETLVEAKALFERALAIDSTYGAARVGIARTIFAQAAIGETDISEAGIETSEIARDELRRNPENAEAWALLGEVAALQGNDPRTAAEHYQRALALDPTNIEVLRSAAQLLRDLGRVEEAGAVLDYLARRDPVNPVTHASRALLARVAGRYEETIRLTRLELSMNPSAYGSNYEIAVSQLALGDAEAALESIVPEPDEEYVVKVQAMAHHALGHTAEHEAKLRELIERWGDRWPSEVAQVYAYRGDADEAFEWLDRAEAQNEDGLDQQHFYYFYDPVRDDPRWQGFLERTGTSKAQLDAIEFEVPIPR